MQGPSEAMIVTTAAGAKRRRAASEKLALHKLKQWPRFFRCHFKNSPKVCRAYGAVCNAGWR